MERVVIKPRFAKVKVGNIYLIVRKGGDMEMNWYSSINNAIRPEHWGNHGPQYDGKDYAECAVAFLNYLLDDEDIDYDVNPEKLSFMLAQRYLNVYSYTPNTNGDYPSTQSRLKKRKWLSCLLLDLKNKHVCPELEQHYVRRVDHQDTETRRVIWDWELSLVWNADEYNHVVYRYCPDYFVEIVTDEAKKHNMDLFMLITLQLDAGVRPAEACNVRDRMSEPYGPGINVIKDNCNGILGMTIDLKKKAIERPLRDDGVKVGEIKRPREVDVYPPNREHLLDVYDHYLEDTKYRKREKYGPLVTSTQVSGGYNRAYTVDDYRKAFKKLVNEHVIPRLIENGGVQEAYAYKLQSSSYGPHFFREYFTTKLVNDGVDWQELMHYRGDKNELSAIRYVVQNQGMNVIEKETSNKLATAIQEREQIRIGKLPKTV